MAMRPISRVDDFHFPEAAWDVRGWTVRTERGEEKVGRVSDMLLDHRGVLRFLDVDLGFLKKHVLVPLEHAHADREGETVWIERLSKRDLEAVPEYTLDPETLNEDYERRLDAVYGGTQASREHDLVAPDEDLDGELDLKRMSDLEDDYQVAGDDPRGWKVITGEGTTIGKVTELLMNPGAMKARFLDVAIDEKKLKLEPVDRHVLLPADRVRLDRGNKRVVVSGLLAGDVATYPQYGGLPVTGRGARALREAYEHAGQAPQERGAETTAPAARDHDRPEATLRHFYGTRPDPGSRTVREDPDR